MEERKNVKKQSYMIAKRMYEFSEKLKEKGIHYKKIAELSNLEAGYFANLKRIIDAYEQNATPHGLRHARITAWLDIGFSTIEVARMAGHNNITSTMRYEHLSTRQLSEKLKKLEEEE